MGVLIFVLGYVICIGTVVLSGLGVSDETSLFREIAQGTVAEMIGSLLLICLFFALVRKHFPSAKQYETSLPHWKIIIGAILICPLLCLLQVAFTFGNIERWFYVESDVSWLEVGELIAFLPFTAIFAPLTEELSMRVFCITQFASKKGKFIAAVTTLLLFAFMHISRWKIVLLSGCIYSLILLLSKNIWTSAIFHMAHNLATIIVPVLTEVYVLIFPNSKYGIMGTPILVVILLIILFGLGVKLLVSQYRFDTGQVAKK